MPAYLGITLACCAALLTLAVGCVLVALLAAPANLGLALQGSKGRFPVLTAPEGLDIWNDEDPKMVEVRQRALGFLMAAYEGEVRGALLPAGWTLIGV